MWQNNKFNLRINNELPKDFSLEDIDGVIRFHYMENGTLYTRLILYEVKSFGEKEIQPAQRKTLNLLQQSIDWTKFDDMSGVFLIKALDENFERSEIYEFKNDTLEYIAEVNFDYYKNWFYNELVL